MANEKLLHLFRVIVKRHIFVKIEIAKITTDDLPGQASLLGQAIY